MIKNEELLFAEGKKSMLEGPFSRDYITPFLKSLDIYYDKPIRGPYTRKGVADYTLVIQGCHIAMEVKRNHTHPTPPQLVEKEAIFKAGGLYFVVRPKTWKIAMEFLLNALSTESLNPKKLQGIYSEYQAQLQ